MKTLEQVCKYLSSCLFSDSDWNMVLGLCREIYVGGKVHRPKRGKYCTTFGEFTTWLDVMPGQGDIVRYGNIIGAVGKCTPSDYVLCAYTGIDGHLIRKDMVVSPSRLVMAEDGEACAFKRLMSEAMVRYSDRLGMLVSIYVPQNGEFVTIRQNGMIMRGVFDRVDGCKYCFYFVDGDGRVAPSSIPFDECELCKASAKDSVELYATFSRLGVMWNPRDKSFREVSARANVGSKYWYVNDKFYVCQANDMKTPLHNERYSNGNYFTSYGEALVFLKKMKELRMELNKGLDL